MKRIICLLLTFLLLSCLAGCTGSEDTVYFYYTPSQIDYGADRELLVAEKRSSLSREDELSYLLSFYFQGPLDKDLKLPVPEGTQVVSLRRTGDTLTLTMSQEFGQLKNMDLTLACSCIAKTCFGLTDAENITFVTDFEDGIHITVSRDGLVLDDETLPIESTD